MEDTLSLLQTAEHELSEIGTEVDLHGEKFSSLHAKVSRFKSNLYRNDAALGRLDRALRTGKFIVMLLFMAIVFSMSLLAVVKIHWQPK